MENQFFGCKIKIFSDNVVYIICDILWIEEVSTKIYTFDEFSYAEGHLSGFLYKKNHELAYVAQP